MKIYESFSDLVGNTPLLRLSSFSNSYNLNLDLIGKMECMNPAGSVKDRVGAAFIKNAINQGLLKDNSVIIEPTSGNTGIGLAAAACSYGYRVILTMPDTMSMERRKLLMAYGAEIILTPGELGMQGAIDKAKDMASSMDNAYMPGQFTNPINPKTHFQTTGPEIWQDTQGKIDIFVSSVGTGGTITGVGDYLKSQNPNIQIIAVEPFSSAVLSGGKPGPHALQGIGAGFIPETLDTNVYDEVITVKDSDAMHATKAFAHSEGVLVGISSGATLWAGVEIARRTENSEKVIVCLLPDTGDRYLSTSAFDS